jgi:hypothetical protein
VTGAGCVIFPPGWSHNMRPEPDDAVTRWCGCGARDVLRSASSPSMVDRKTLISWMCSVSTGEVLNRWIRVPAAPPLFIGQQLPTGRQLVDLSDAHDISVAHRVDAMSRQFMSTAHRNIYSSALPLG